jgi:hypothetical protein
MDPVVIEHLGRGQPFDRHIGDFLTYPFNAAASRQTIRVHRGDLLQFAAHHDGEIGELTTSRYSSCAICSADWRAGPPRGPRPRTRGYRRPGSRSRLHLQQQVGQVDPGQHHRHYLPQLLQRLRLLGRIQALHR